MSMQKEEKEKGHVWRREKVRSGGKKKKSKVARKGGEKGEEFVACPSGEPGRGGGGGGGGRNSPHNIRSFPFAFIDFRNFQKGSPKRKDFSKGKQNFSLFRSVYPFLLEKNNKKEGGGGNRGNSPPWYSEKKQKKTPLEERCAVNFAEHPQKKGISRIYRKVPEGRCQPPVQKGVLFNPVKSYYCGTPEALLDSRESLTAQGAKKEKNAQQRGTPPTQRVFTMKKSP